jgi:hypothetical protein
MPKRQGGGSRSLQDQAGERLAAYEEHRAVDTVTVHRGGKNLRAIGAGRDKEPLPKMLPFDSSRVMEGGYSSRTKTLYVRFVDGTPWNYFGVEQNEWRNFRRSVSPGRYINRVLNAKDYGRGAF